MARSPVRLTADEMPGAMPTLAADPRELLLAAPMSAHQILAVAVTVALCALDGFDILAITFAAPGIVAAWGIDRTQLGIVFSVGLVGIAAGSLLVAPLADVIGRRAMILWCLLLMSVGTLLSGFSTSVASLGAYRLLTGLGIGAMIATINPLAAEYANARRRDLCVGLMAVGFPLGGVVGGYIVAWLLRHYDWRSIFFLASALSVLIVPLVLRWMPEPLGFLVEQRSPRALERVNAFLERCGHAPVGHLPPPRSTATGGARLASIFGAGMIGPTLLITAIYFLYVMTVYFFLSWIPTLVADLGFSRIRCRRCIGHRQSQRRRWRRSARLDGSPTRAQGALDRGTARHGRVYRGIRIDAGQSAVAEGRCWRRRIFPVRRNDRFVRHHRANVSNSRSSDWHRFCHRHRPRRQCTGAVARGIVVRGGLGARRCLRPDGHRGCRCGAVVDDLQGACASGLTLALSYR